GGGGLRRSGRCARRAGGGGGGRQARKHAVGDGAACALPRSAEPLQDPGSHPPGAESAAHAVGEAAAQGAREPVRGGGRDVTAVGPGVLAIDAAAEAARIAAAMRAALRDLGRRGFVVALSGGVDSAVCAALAAGAVGPSRVLALSLPEVEAPADAVARAQRIAAVIGIDCIVQDITATLDAIGCYRARDEAIRRVVPGYGPGWKSKIAIRGGVDGR